MTHSDIEDLIRLFSKLPGLGPRSARRVVLHLMRSKERVMLPLADSLARAAESIRHCARCGNLDSTDPCHICNDERRDPSVLCVVEEVADLWAIERCNLYKGQYHVLGGTLSAMEDRGPGQLNIEPLIKRAFSGQVKEIILATNATLEGQTTAHYIMDKLDGAGVSISRLAQGIPIGGELDYLDDGTLGAALRARLPA
ncbi:MAG: recombination mediator RecR [Alphaproteobacteria bacterium]|nr:recombination mediator RecR [Alphaproteobacteria bacterium]